MVKVKVVEGKGIMPAAEPVFTLEIFQPLMYAMFPVQIVMGIEIFPGPI